MSLFCFEYPLLADDLFSRALKAEVKNRPLLLELKEENAPKYTPNLAFGRRRKGFHKAPALERVLVLQVFRWMPVRGEFFVKTKLKGTEVPPRLASFRSRVFLEVCLPAVRTSATIV